MLISFLLVLVWVQFYLILILIPMNVVKNEVRQLDIKLYLAYLLIDSERVVTILTGCHLYFHTILLEISGLNFGYYSETLVLLQMLLYFIRTADLSDHLSSY